MFSSSPAANDTRQSLRSLEDASALDLLPTLVLLGLLAFLGLVGNSLSLYVYYTRFKPSSTRTYILAMSVFDLLFSGFSMPGEILDLRFSLTYDNAWLCAMERFVTMFITLGAGFILIAVALDRRRKICCPLRPQVTARYVTLSVLGCVAAALVLSVPFGVLNGRHTVPTDIPGVAGSTCSVDDRFRGTRFPLVYNIILVVIFLASTAAMTTSYVQIARRIVQHRQQSQLASEGLAQALDKLDSHSDEVTGDQDSSLRVKYSGHYEENPSAVLQENSLHERHSNAEECSADVDPGSEGHFRDSKSYRAKGVCQPSSVLPTTKDEQLQGDGDGDVSVRDPEDRTTAVFAKNKTQGPGARSTGSTCFRSQSVQEKEEELEMAVRILVHAVSEDIVGSHELFAHRLSRLVKARSASLGDVSVTHVSHVTVSVGQQSAEDHDASAKRAADDEVFHVSQMSDLQEDDHASTDPRSALKNGDIITTTASSELKGSGCRPSDVGASTEGKVDTAVPKSGSDRVPAILRSTLQRVTSLKREGSDVTSQKGVTSQKAVTSTLPSRLAWKKIPSRTTWMMFVLTAIFVVSYLPYLAIKTVRAVRSDLEVLQCSDPLSVLSALSVSRLPVCLSCLPVCLSHSSAPSAVCLSCLPCLSLVCLSLVCPVCCLSVLSACLSLVCPVCLSRLPVCLSRLPCLSAVCLSACLSLLSACLSVLSALSAVCLSTACLSLDCLSVSRLLVCLSTALSAVCLVLARCAK